ncbi:YhdP family protein [Rhizobium paknamense]|uniref:DUF3971 domain-containing protein n=1 Tax=Rhizobium paknamense TaxID=1206817 RepID=A0ABU0ICI3_9HYPH|nr:DUF3971 domain-containing protein [Rhizobium paknamense]MDQ0455941.1 hypothetical protein [Rhizobium paknamense]
MGEIRGEKVRFRKKDLIALESLPSAQVDDPMIVHCPPRRGMLTRLWRGLAFLCGLAAVLLAVFVAAVETGTLDRLLSTGAQAAFQSAVGPGLKAEIGGTSIRFSKHYRLAVAAENVTITDGETGKQVSRTDTVKLVIDPLALLTGRVAVNEIEAEGTTFDSSLFPAGGQTDFSKVRVDAVPSFLEKLFINLDQVRGFIARGSLDRLRLGGITFNAQDNLGHPVAISVDDLALIRRKDGALAIHGQIGVNGKDSILSAEATVEGDRTTSLAATMTDLEPGALLLKRLPDGTLREGADARFNLDFVARRGTIDRAPVLSARVRADKGTIYLDGDAQELTRADLNLFYDFDKLTVELKPSVLDFGRMHVPFSGGVIDLDRLPQGQGQPAGYGLDLVVQNGTAFVESAGEEAFPFSIKAFGTFIHQTKELNVSEFSVLTPYGNMSSQVRVLFGDQSPEIHFHGEIGTMRTLAVKQLWPFWMASKPRAWVLANLFGGTISNASIDVFIPAGRMKFIPTPLNLGPDELQIRFDIADSRMNVTGEIPPIRDMTGHFDLKGPHMEVKVKEGTSYFASGRKVQIDDGLFTIANTYQKPLMGNIALSLSGSADAMAELATFKPMAALQKTEFVPEDFAGDVKADVTLTTGLINDQNPPPPEWKADLELSNVDLKRPFMDRKIADFDGTLSLDQKAALLAGKAKIDDVPMEISLREPVDKKYGVTPDWKVKGRLSDDDRNKLTPGLGALVSGPVDIEISRLDDKRQLVKSDLTAATLSVPWVGWSKGSGIAAKASVELTPQGQLQSLDKFELDGEGFGASGKLVVSKNGLVSADLDKVRLASADDFGVSVQMNKGVTSIKVVGKAMDGRPLFKKLKSSGTNGAPGSGKSDDVDVRVDLDKILGFNDEVLTGVKLNYATRGGNMTALKLSGVTDSGQAVVAQSDLSKGEPLISVIAGDAGDVARLADVYSHMRGGLLDLKIRGALGENWSGNLDIRNFRVENEDRLQKIVSTPADDEGRSLNSAVKKDIDVRSEKFQRAFSRIIYRDGVLRTENGIVRGEQVGATFQGVLKDAAGRMDMTGTFMPAYGLNRLFAEVPVIGFILGNGRDRGLLGITFKLTGPIESPRLTVNPLSLIAPGVFRQIFEFQ